MAEDISPGIPAAPRRDRTPRVVSGFLGVLVALTIVLGCLAVLTLILIVTVGIYLHV